MDDFPIGAIVAYAGPLHSGLEDTGWMPCDGRGLSVTDTSFQPLLDVIQSSYGADSNYKYIPFLAGYFLRGVDPNATVDSDAKARLAPTKHEIAGATGADPGSVQMDGVGSHRHPIRSYPGVQGANDHGDGPGCIFRYDPQPNNATTSPTGGSETRPPNMSVYFLIKYKNATQSSMFPAGAVIAYADTVAGDPMVAQGWMPCDGRALNPDDTSSNYAMVHAAIAETYGATAANWFCVPDYQGIFLRGVDGGRGLDPDAAARTAPRPDLPIHGAAGDNVGSKQDFLLGAHTHPYVYRREEHCLHPDDEYADTDFLWNTWGDNTSDPAGDCEEVRPKNMAVNRLICWNPKLPSFQVPKNAIIAYAGPLKGLNDTTWAACDGTGGTPDYRGQFLRGADANRAVNTAQLDGLTKHTHGYQYSNGETKESYSDDTPIVAGDCTTQLTDIPGPGDTRPKNTAVHFLIKTQ